MNQPAREHGSTVEHLERESRFVLRRESRESFLEYDLRDDGSMVVHRTFVPDADRGQGIASVLTRRAVEFAAHHQLQVVPLCSYVATWLERHPEFSHLTDKPKGTTL